MSRSLRGVVEVQQVIQGALHAHRTSVEHVGVAHRRPDIRVTEQLLDGPDVVTRLQQVGRKRMPKRVAAGGFTDATRRDRGVDGALQGRLVHVMAQATLGMWLDVGALRRNYPSPNPLRGRVRVLDAEGVRQSNGPRTTRRPTPDSEWRRSPRGPRQDSKEISPPRVLRDAPYVWRSRMLRDTGGSTPGTPPRCTGCSVGSQDLPRGVDDRRESHANAALALGF